MLPLVLGAAGAAWLVSKFVPNREGIRLNFPFVPYEWWSPRGRFFKLEELMIEASPRFLELEPDSAVRPSFEATITMLERERKATPRRAAKPRKTRPTKPAK